MIGLTGEMLPVLDLDDVSQWVGAHAVRPHAVRQPGVGTDERADRGRMLVGLAGPPGVGKSTVSARLASELGERAVVIGMDGFHLAHTVLVERGLDDVKGAPETFDVEGFIALLTRLQSATGEHPVYAPVFDRTNENPIAGAVAVEAHHEIVIVEGNYLLLDGAWARVRTLMDAVIYLDLADDVRRRRLIERHVAHGRSRGDAKAFVARSDEANATLVAATRHRADVAVAVG